MVGVNGGLDVEEDFYSFSIIDYEPIFIFRVGDGFDCVSTFSQLKKDFRFIGKYLFKNQITIKDIRHIFHSPEKVKETELTFYKVYNYDLIVSFGSCKESEDKARKWLINKIFETEPYDRVKWIKDKSYLKECILNNY